MSKQPSVSRFVFPVIHTQDSDQALSEAEICFRGNADGVFFIGHGQVKGDLLTIALKAKEKFPRLYVGINHLGMSPLEAMFHVGSLDMLWTDNASIDETGKDNKYAKQVWDVRKRFLPNLYYFGGTAFKHQREVRDLENAADIASDYMDVICTSGPATGVSADPEKIMRLATKAKKPLALASGVTPENVNEYLPYVECFLVASGINMKNDFYHIDPLRLRALVEAVRSYQNSL